LHEVQGCKGRGRPKKTWEQCVKCDIRKYGMQRVNPLIETSDGVVVGLFDITEDTII